MEDVAELPIKAKFRSLDEITNKENIDVLNNMKISNENKQYDFSENKMKIR